MNGGSCILTNRFYVPLIEIKQHREIVPRLTVCTSQIYTRLLHSSSHLGICTGYICMTAKKEPHIRHVTTCTRYGPCMPTRCPSNCSSFGHCLYECCGNCRNARRLAPMRQSVMCHLTLPWIGFFFVQELISFFFSPVG